jgi:hypothetical protein
VAEARCRLDRARQLLPIDPALAYIVDNGARHHRWRGDFYSRQDDHELAIRDHEADLIVDPADTAAWAGRTRSRAARGRDGSWTDVPPLPDTAGIVAAGQAIPGRLQADEAELLVALRLLVAARLDPEEPLRLLVVGPSAGRAAITTGLALRSLGREDLCVGVGDVFEDAVLRENLAIYGIAELVAHGSESDLAARRVVGADRRVIGSNEWGRVAGWRVAPRAS